MENMIEKAIIFATEHHKGQKRKDGSTYIFHPLETMLNAREATLDPEILIACVLHDTVEDGGASLKEIEEIFGKRVAYIVEEETDKKYYEDGTVIPWKVKKEKSIESIKNTNEIGLKILILADKLSNLMSIQREMVTNEKDLFNIFNENDKSKQAWYYKELLENTKELEETVLYNNFKNMFNIIFNVNERELSNGKNNRIKR